MSAASDFIRHRGGIFWLGWLVWTEIGAVWAQAPTLVHYETLELAAALLMALVIGEFLSGGKNAGKGAILLAVLVGSAAGQGALALAQTIHGGPLGLSQLGEMVGTWTVAGGVYRG